jgi:hypothetical protein
VLVESNKVAACLVRRRLAAAALTALLAACGMGEPGSGASRPFTPDIQGISDAIATGAHYPTSAIELTSSEVRLRIEVSDVKLAMADEATRSGAAAALVGVAEQVLASHPEYAKLQAISVAIIHPSPAGTASMDWHIEDVVKFRKGPGGRFSLHIT